MATAMETTTATMTVEGFEHLGAIVVRPRTFRDSMIIIPLYVDQEINRAMAEIGIEDVNPSGQLRYNAMMIAIARTVIVEPPDLVDKLLESTKGSDFTFFGKFAEEYTDWMDAQSEEAQEKKSGGTQRRGSGKKSASSSESDGASPQLTLAG
jgi:hypothetical protein